MPEGWEVSNGLNPLLDDANRDADSDSFSNLEEYQAGTNPQNASDAPLTGVVTGTTTSITGNSATLNGTVDPGGSYASTTVVFEWGTDTSYGNQTTATQSPATGTTAQTVSANLTGLASSTTYHYRVKAANRVRTTYGTDQSFTTTSYVYVNRGDGTCNGKSPCYASIQEAVNAAKNGGVIKIAGETYGESITLNESKSVTLQGGWDSSFSTQTANTTFIKAPKTQNGSVTLQMVTIKP